MHVCIMLVVEINSSKYVHCQFILKNHISFGYGSLHIRQLNAGSYSGKRIEHTHRSITWCNSTGEDLTRKSNGWILACKVGLNPRTKFFVVNGSHEYPGPAMNYFLKQFQIRLPMVLKWSICCHLHHLPHYSAYPTCCHLRLHPQRSASSTCSHLHRHPHYSA
jgi:hypothetical protein